MKLLITSLPGYGHLCPLIPLARAVQTAGHKVAFATSRAVAGTLVPTDLPVFSCGPDWSETDFSHDTALHAHATIRLPLHKYIAETVVPQMINDVGALIEQWRPDIVLSNEYERTGCALAEKYGIPFVLLSAGPRVSHSCRRQWHAPLYALPRRILNLPVDWEMNYAFKWLHLYLTPSEYALDANYQEANTECAVRIESTDLAAFSSNRFDKSILDLSRKQILCTFGTVFNKNKALINTIINAFDGSPYQLILTWVPDMHFEVATKNQNVIALSEHIPLSQILPYIDLCITHGGTSTLLTLLQHGKPLLLLPQGADQNVNAITCVRLGLAECDFNSMPRAIGIELGDVCLQSTTVKNLVEKLLLNTEMRQHCLNMREKFLKLPKLDFAADLLERLAHTKVPYTRSSSK